MSQEEEVKWYRGLAIISLVVGELVVSVSLFLGVSSWIASRYQLASWIVLVSGFLGFGIGGWRVLLYLKKIEKSEKL